MANKIVSGLGGSQTKMKNETIIILRLVKVSEKSVHTLRLRSTDCVTMYSFWVQPLSFRYINNFAIYELDSIYELE